MSTITYMPAGGQRAQCAATYSNGQTETVGVTIQTDGQMYMTDSQ